VTPPKLRGSYVVCGDIMTSAIFTGAPFPYSVGQVCPESGRYRMIGYRIARVLRWRFV